MPYKGAPEAVNDLIGGRISFVFINATVGIPQVQAGNIKALAITSEQRSSIAPDVPTMREAGFADFKVEQWLGFLAPAKTPKPVVDTIASAVKKSLANEEVKATLAQNAIDIETGSTPETFEMVVKSDMQKWREVAKTANIKAN